MNQDKKKNKKLFLSNNNKGKIQVAELLFVFPSGFFLFLIGIGLT